MTTKSEKRQRLFLHDGALALASKVSSGYCTVPLLHRQCLSPVLTSVPEWCYFSVVLRYTNNHHHPYIDSTTVLSDTLFTLHQKSMPDTSSVVSTAPERDENASKQCHDVWLRTTLRRWSDTRLWNVMKMAYEG